MKPVLITGVSSGIGYDATRYLIGKGYPVIGTVRKESDIKRLSAEFGDQFTGILMDVTKTNEIEQAFQTVKSSLNGGSLTALVNNAGLSISGPMSLLSDEQLRYQMEVNFFGVRNVTNTFLPLLGGEINFKGKPGKIINISSLAGIFNTPFNGAYCISKHAVESLGEIYRRELMVYGIDVISILAGPIASEIWTKSKGEMDEYFDSDYGPVIKEANRVYTEYGEKTLPAIVISKMIHKIIRSKRPKPRYLINRNLWRTIIFTKVLPSRLVDWLLFRKFSRQSVKPISG